MKCLKYFQEQLSQYCFSIFFLVHCLIHTFLTLEQNVKFYQDSQSRDVYDQYRSIDLDLFLFNRFVHIYLILRSKLAFVMLTNRSNSFQPYS